MEDLDNVKKGLENKTTRYDHSGSDILPPGSICHGRCILLILNRQLINKDACSGKWIAGSGIRYPFGSQDCKKDRTG